MSIKGIANLADLMEDLPAAGTQDVDLSLIDPDPHQPRTSFDELRLEALAASVAAQGVIEPLIVRARNGRYQIIAGERKLRRRRGDRGASENEIELGIETRDQPAAHMPAFGVRNVTPAVAVRLAGRRDRAASQEQAIRAA